MRNVKNITKNPKILGGEPIIKGTRISVSTVLEHLENGQEKKDVAKIFQLTRGQIDAALKFARQKIETAK